MDNTQSSTQEIFLSFSMPGITTVMSFLVTLGPGLSKAQEMPARDLSALRPDIHGTEQEMEAEDTAYCNLTPPNQDCPLPQEMPTLTETYSVNCGSAYKAIMDFTDDWMNTLPLPPPPYLDITTNKMRRLREVVNDFECCKISNTAFLP